MSALALDCAENSFAISTLPLREGECPEGARGYDSTLRTMFWAGNEYDKIYAMKSHRATGRPRGRPPSLPFDLAEKILCDLESRMDKTTQLVVPDLGNLQKG